MSTNENSWMEKKTLTVPVKITKWCGRTIGSRWQIDIDIPTLGIHKSFDANLEDDVRKLVEFFEGEPCNKSCHGCEHFGYYLTCYKLSNFIEKLNKEKTHEKILRWK